MGGTFRVVPFMVGCLDLGMTISVRDQKMYTEVLVGVVAACDIMKWTTGVGVIGTRWADPGENTRNRQILVRGNTKTEKD